jgi:hypothetical protein
MRFVLVSFVLALSLSACSGVKTERATRPDAPEEARREARGKLTGEEGLTIGGMSDEEKASLGSPIGVNSFLWRASLDTLSFLPLVSADPFGGTIITDWYEDPKVPGERFKVNVLILDRSLRADGVKLTVFKQKLIGSGWRDQKVDDKLARTLEDTILTRARQLKIRQSK